MTRPYGGGNSVEGGSNLNVKVGQIYLTINSTNIEYEVDDGAVARKSVCPMFQNLLLLKNCNRDSDTCRYPLMHIKIPFITIPDQKYLSLLLLFYAFFYRQE